jgi:hypothetical protein
VIGSHKIHISYARVNDKRVLEIIYA